MRVYLLDLWQKIQANLISSYNSYKTRVDSGRGLQRSMYETGAGRKCPCMLWTRITVRGEFHLFCFFWQKTNAVDFEAWTLCSHVQRSQQMYVYQKFNLRHERPPVYMRNIGRSSTYWYYPWSLWSSNLWYFGQYILCYRLRTICICISDQDCRWYVGRRLVLTLYQLIHDSLYSWIFVHGPWRSLRLHLFLSTFKYIPNKQWTYPITSYGCLRCVLSHLLDL